MTFQIIVSPPDSAASPELPECTGQFIHSLPSRKRKGNHIHIPRNRFKESGGFLVPLTKEEIKTHQMRETLKAAEQAFYAHRTFQPSSRKPIDELSDPEVRLMYQMHLEKQSRDSKPVDLAKLARVKELLQKKKPE